MKALIFDGQLTLQQVPDPVPKKGEALIRVRYSSICNTDLEIIQGYMGYKGILGHEFAGEVVSKESKFFGKDVVGEINIACGKCYLCKTGRKTHCINRTVMGIFEHPGCFAGYIVLPEANLHVIPANVDMPTAALTEPLAAALEIFEQTKIKPTDNVFIFGAGKLGLLIAQVFRLSGCEYTLYDINPWKVEFAKGLGLSAALPEAIGADQKAEICVDCTGNPKGIETALSHLYPCGKLILKTTVANPAKLNLNKIVMNEFNIIGSRCGVFEPALSLLSQKLIDVEPMITKVFPFDELVEAFQFAAQPDTIKALIRH
ncbi:MAG: alcohol dehydrogenase catalytic domain-containing protein [Bacteroidales bacterium]|nr:alcohol dehydrogenase catalytic domain-containing protein [Bacteroidales bacterium]